MRISLKALLLILYTPLFGQSITIATFNVRIFSNGFRDDAELYEIGELLKEYDFIALQEVRDTEILDRTVSMLKIVVSPLQRASDLACVSVGLRGCAQPC